MKIRKFKPCCVGYAFSVAAMLVAPVLANETSTQPAPTSQMSPASQPSADLKVLKTFEIGGEGGWDYVRLDDSGKLLFVPRTTHTMVLNTADGKTVADIAGTQLAHGVALVPSVNRGFISDGQDGSVVIFDLKTYAVLGKVKTDQDSDGIIYDEATNKVVVVCGDPGKMFTISPDVDPVNGKADPAIDLEGSPEYLATDGKGMAYVNIADKANVAQVDIKAGKVLAHWPTTPSIKPTGMAIDRENGILFVGCRSQRMIVMSTKDGSVLGNYPIGRTVDACAFDKGKAYASCGDGTLTVINEDAPDKFSLGQKVKTLPAARTMALDPATGLIYLPTADMEPAVANEPGKPKPRPKAIPGTFKIVVVGSDHS